MTGGTAGSQERATTWLGVAVLSCATAQAQGPPEPRPLYLEVAKRYAAGERAAAVADLGRFSLRELSVEMDTLRARVLAPACAGCLTPEDPPPLRAIVLLHTDRDDLEARLSELTEERAPTCGVGPHAKLAERAVVLVRGDGRGRDFARRFYLAMALRGLDRGCLDDALASSRAGLEAFPRDADLLFANGTILETTAAAANQTRPFVGPIPPSMREAAWGLLQARRLLFEEAKKAFEQVVAADPARDEARLHLERPARARKTLEDILARAPGKAVLYLAHLFLGRVHETEGRLEAAEEQYALAFALDPAQSAAVPLSYLLQLKGESEEARAVLEGALREARGRTLPDFFWVYSFGPSTAHTEMFQRLREEAGR